MEINKDRIETLYSSRFLKCYDLQYAEGKHYFEASRRAEKDLVVKKNDDDFRKMLPDAVTIAVVMHLPKGETKLLLSYEYRYAVGQFLLSPVAGLLDPEDINSDNPLVNAAIREIKEEAGITVKESDKVIVLNPCAFSTPGMTDESNAFLCADITLDDLHELNQEGAVGSELFAGFELVDVKEAEKLFSSGRDKNGNFFSLATWAVLGYFLREYC